MDERICAGKIENVRESGPDGPGNSIFPAKTSIYARQSQARDIFRRGAPPAKGCQRRSDCRKAHRARTRCTSRTRLGSTGSLKPSTGNNWFRSELLIYELIW